MILQATSVFDSLAANYDADFTVSGIGQLQRQRVWLFLTPLLSTGSPLRILEINCGTGEDALRLASMGHSVIATDASAAMIEKAKLKSGEAGTSLQVVFEVCPFDQLKKLFGAEPFDLVFSNFGGLNCIDPAAVKQLSNDLFDLVKPSGHLFLVLLSSCCLWEVAHYGIRGKIKTAFRRFKKTADFAVNGQTMPVHYYSPGRLRKIFAPVFKFAQANPVGLFIPPSYLEERFKTRPQRLQRLNTLEKKFAGPALSAFADHYCAIFKKPGDHT